MTTEETLADIRARIDEVGREFFEICTHPVHLLSARTSRDELLRMAGSDAPEDIERMDLAVQRLADANRVEYTEALNIFSETLPRAKELNRLEDEGQLGQDAKDLLRRASTLADGKTTHEAEGAALKRFMEPEEEPAGPADPPFSQMDASELAELDKRIREYQEAHGTSYAEAANAVGEELDQ